MDVFTPSPSMDVFSSYKVKIIGTDCIVSTTIVDSSRLVDRFVSELWDWADDPIRKPERTIIDDDEQNPVLVVGLAVEYCDDDNADDSNTSTNTNKKVATLQLCNVNYSILIQLLHLEKIPMFLKELLSEDKKFAFVGVGIRDALVNLERDYGLKCKSGIELGPVLSRVCKKSQFFDSTMEELALEMAGINIEKPITPSLTHWGARDLRNEQIDYAITKAYASYCIAEKLMKKEIKK